MHIQFFDTLVAQLHCHHNQQLPSDCPLSKQKQIDHYKTQEILTKGS